MKQRLALARALLGTPRLLLLDEPTNGLDPDGIIAMRALIRALPDQIGGTVFVSSHLLSEVQQVADHAGVMRDGRLIVQDRVSALLGEGSATTFTIDQPAAGAALLAARGTVARAIDARTLQPFGLLHGGASVLLAETLGSLAANLCLEDPSQGQAVGLEINANHLRAMTQGTVTGTARPLHVGRSTQVWEIRIEDEQGRAVCISRLTLAMRYAKQ